MRHVTDSQKRFYSQCYVYGAYCHCFARLSQFYAPSQYYAPGLKLLFDATRLFKPNKILQLYLMMYELAKYKRWMENYIVLVRK